MWEERLNFVMYETRKACPKTLGTYQTVMLNAVNPEKCSRMVDTIKLVW